MLAALPEVAAKFRGWRLVILGEGPEREALTQLACSLGIGDRTSCRGWMQEPGDALSNADLFVLSSRYEGFPNALLEAMACGLPVLATQCIGAREIITHDTDGWLVPVDSVADLAAALRQLMSDELLRKRLGKAAMHINTRFSLPTAVREWDEILAPVACRTA